MKKIEMSLLDASIQVVSYDAAIAGFPFEVGATDYNQETKRYSDSHDFRFQTTNFEGEFKDFKDIVSKNGSTFSINQLFHIKCLSLGGSVQWEIPSLLKHVYNNCSNSYQQFFWLALRENLDYGQPLIQGISYDEGGEIQNSCTNNPFGIMKEIFEMFNDEVPNKDFEEYFCENEELNCHEYLTFIQEIYGIFFDHDMSNGFDWYLLFLGLASKFGYY